MNAKKTLLFIAMIALSWAAAPSAMAADACVEPDFGINIPEGSGASSEAMAEAQAAVQKAVSDAETYIECVQSNQSRSQAERATNSTLDNMEKLAAAFNRQLRYYRRASS